MERIEKINELIAQISPINYDKILLETKLYFAKRQETPNSEEINKLEAEISNLNQSLAPLFEQLRNLQCKYRVEFEGELSNADGSTYWNQPETRIFNLQTCCQVDTVINTWGPYINDPCVNQLIQEIHQIIFQQFYSNFRILNITRI